MKDTKENSTVTVVAFFKYGNSVAAFALEMIEGWAVAKRYMVFMQLTTFCPKKCEKLPGASETNNLQNQGNLGRQLDCL